MVSVNDLACSWISFCIKCLYSPLAALTGSQGTTWTSAGTGRPSSVITVKESRVTRAIWWDSKKDHPLGMWQHGRQIRGDKHLALPNAQRYPAGIADARRDQLVRLARAHHHNAVGPVQTFQGAPDGHFQGQTALQVALYQLNNHLGISFRAENNPSASNSLAQRHIVLHNAIVDSTTWPFIPMWGCAFRSAGTP